MKAQEVPIEVDQITKSSQNNRAWCMWMEAQKLVGSYASRIGIT
jgi:hypothetical protein